MLDATRREPVNRQGLRLRSTIGSDSSIDLAECKQYLARGAALQVMRMDRTVARLSQSPGDHAWPSSE